MTDRWFWRGYLVFSYAISVFLALSVVFFLGVAFEGGPTLLEWVAGMGFGAWVVAMLGAGMAGFPFGPMIPPLAPPMPDYIKPNWDND